MSSAVTGVPTRVYVPNSRSGTVDVIDPRTYKVIAHYRTGVAQHHVTPSWDLRHLYVDDIYANALTVIDPKSGKPTGKIPVTDPYNVYFTPGGSTAIVVAERYQRLDFRDPRTWKTTRSVAIPVAGPDHLDFSPDGRFLMISCEYSGYVCKVDVTKGKVVGRVKVGGLPVDVKLSPDGRFFYVANQGTNGVSIVDPIPMRQVRFLHTGRGTHGLAVSRDSQALYASNRLNGTISVISFQKLAVIATWRVGGSPDMMQVSADGRRLWTSNRFNRSVSVIDTTTGRLLHTITVGSNPHGLALFPQPGRFCIGHNGVYR